MKMSSHKVYDVVVVGGGPIGWAAAYEIAKVGSSVIVLEQNNFFNQAGSSNDMARMFRTMCGGFMLSKIDYLTSFQVHRRFHGRFSP